MESIGVSPTVYLVYCNSSFESELLFTLTQHPPPLEKDVVGNFREKRDKEGEKGVCGRLARKNSENYLTHARLLPSINKGIRPPCRHLCVFACMHVSSLQ